MQGRSWRVNGRVESRRPEHEYIMNKTPPPPINVLATALTKRFLSDITSANVNVDVKQTLVQRHYTN